MKTVIFFCLFTLLNISLFGQNKSTEYKTTVVNKKVKDFTDQFDLSSPLLSQVTCSYLFINGKDYLFGKASSMRFKYIITDTVEKKTDVPQSQKDLFLNSVIKECITYKDSLACAISLKPDSTYDIRWFELENHKWVNLGDDQQKSLQGSRDFFKLYAETNLKQLRQLLAINQTPTDTSAFVNYLKTNGKDPVPFIISKLKANKLVILGEIHFRTPSWDFCTKLIQDSLFAQNTGIIFMEMEANRQAQIDQFFANETLDKELLLNIFRDYMITGWGDKGRFDFLVALWHINKKLPKTKKIRVVFVDTPRIFTEEGIKNEIQNRDSFMAATIIKTLEIMKDTRNTFFIVGSAHAYRTGETAGAILCKKMKGTVYAVFTHCPVMDNKMIIPERIRKGMFDYAFYKNSDKPVAFDLKNSPFGKEPFDGLYLDGSGSFQENYDGYIFFGSLDQEKSPEMLDEMYSDAFIHEMDRRFRLMGWNFSKEWGLKELSVDAVLQVVKADYTPLKWQPYLKPLNPKK